MEIIQIAKKLTVINPAVSSYKYIHIIEKTTTNGTTIYESIVTDDSSEHTLETDGLYKVTSMKITTTPGSGFYISGNSVYNLNGLVVTAQELVDIIDINSTNIVKETQDYFSDYIVTTYYRNLIQSKFLKGLCACGCMDSQEKITVDSLTMGINLLEILLENGLYYEAQLIIEKLTVCTNIITSSCSCHG